MSIVAYSDADWAGDKEDRRSTTGYCVYVNGNLISWNTKKQKTVALSTSEAELMAITEATKEIEWTQQILEEMGYGVRQAAVLFTDNQGTEKMTKNDVCHEKSKHIAIKHYRVRDLQKEGKISVKWIRTEGQTADIFTKPLPYASFSRHRGQMMVSRL